MILDKQSLDLMKELLALLDEKAYSEQGTDENEEGMRDILSAVVNNDYGYVREILQDYKS